MAAVGLVFAAVPPMFRLDANFDHENAPRVVAALRASAAAAKYEAEATEQRARAEAAEAEAKTLGTELAAAKEDLGEIGRAHV